MAVLDVNFLSQTLKRKVPVRVVLPSDIIAPGGAGAAAGPYKTLYLLHGLTGNYTDWTMNTNIQQLAEHLSLAVVMPSGDNSFYVDSPVVNNAYGEYIGRELVEITRSMFPLSRRREDTFIAGLSMGGFGAIRNGLKYYETFGYIAVLSGAVHVFEFSPEDPRREMIFSEDAVFGDILEAAKTDKNPRVAFDKIAGEHGEAVTSACPKIYMSCGLQDSLITANRSLRDYLREGGADVTWDEENGIHDWASWQRQIEKVLKWLPLTGDEGPATEETLIRDARKAQNS